MLFIFQVVLANGDVVKTASRARKSAAGFVLFFIFIKKYVVYLLGDSWKLSHVVSFIKFACHRYDLTRLVIGSEGTLGVITEVTLRLQKIPQYSVVC